MSTKAHTNRMDTTVGFWTGVGSRAAGPVLRGRRCAGLGVLSGGEARKGVSRAALGAAGEISGASWEAAAFAALEVSALAGIVTALWV